VVSWCQPAAGCQTGTPVLCHAHSGTPEHTTGTGFVPGRVTSEAPVAVGLCVLNLTSGASRQAERRHSAWTAVGPAGIQRYPQGVTLIQLGDDQCSDHCQQGVLRERPSHAMDLAQCCKTRSDGVDDLGLHGDASVDVDTKIPGCSDWRHQGITPTRTGPVGIWC